ncbi:MAG TPA: tyrosine-type recombinase/integrase [Chloroflexota bacterium]
MRTNRPSRQTARKQRGADGNGEVHPLVREFLDVALVEEGLAPRTVATYRQVLAAFTGFVAAWRGEAFAPERLDREAIRAFQHHLVVERGLDEATYVKYVSALRSFLAFLHEEGRTPLGRDDARLPKQHLDLSSIKALSLDEVEALLRAPDPRTPWGRRDRAILAMLYSTGMRVAELCALDRSQVREDLLGQAPVYELPIVGKGRRPRVVFLDALAQALLRQYLETRDDDFPALFRPYRGRATEEGRLTPRMIQAALARYARQAGLATTPTPHTLRHTFAVHKLQAGADVRIVQAFLGHASLSTTQRYTRVTDRYLREAYLEAHRPLALAATTPEST